MSAFLGPIHHWLYNKILWQEALLLDVAALAPETQAIVIAANSKYGAPETAPLETVIQTDNIHGWLQSKIESLEGRTAYVITKALDSEIITLEQLEALYKTNGEMAREKIGVIENPEDVFKGMQNILLDGMPCDRVNQPIEASDDIMRWEKRTCLHTPFWEAVGGNGAVFNQLRDAWLKGFVPSEMVLTILPTGEHIVKRSQ